MSSALHSVPVSNLPRLVQQVKEDAAAAGIICPIVGHVGDGNFHAALIYRDPKEFRKVEELSKKVVDRALELEGTCRCSLSALVPSFYCGYLADISITGTGEHGVGVGKRRYLEKELGKGTVDLMRAIKRTIDPNNMMNPGKVSLCSSVWHIEGHSLIRFISSCIHLQIDGI